MNNMKRNLLLTIPTLLALALVGCQDLNTFPEGSTITVDQKKEIYSNDPSKAVAGVNAIFAQFSQYEPNYNALKAGRHNDFGYPSIMIFTDANGCDVVPESPDSPPVAS